MPMSSSRLAVVSSSVDIEFARRLISELREMGHDVLDLAKTDVSNPEQHSAHLRDVDAFLVVLSAEALHSAWFERELANIRTLLGDGMPRQVIVAQLGHAEIPPELQDFLAVNFNGQPHEDALLDLAQALDRAGIRSSAGEERARGIVIEPPAPDEVGSGLPVEEASRGESPYGSSFEPSAPPALTPPAAPPPPAPAPVPAPAATPRPAPGAVSPDVFPVPAGAPMPEDSQTTGSLGRSRFLRTDPEAVAVRSSEQVTFTAYHPREMEAQDWQQMLVYISLDTPQSLAGVAADADERLGARKGDYRAAPARRSAAIKRGTRVSIIPTLDGFTFNPPSMTVSWEEDVQRHDFRLRATTAPVGRAANGSIQFYAGVLLLAEVPISVYVRQPGERADIPMTFASIVARAYRRIFASYSHNDTAIVRSCESAAKALGDRYLMDVNLLRAGQEWDERLLRAIGEADVFQLFWSEKAAHSAAVEKEWRHALALARRGFVRPVYWTRQPYAIPPELASIHFDRLDLTRMGLSATKRFAMRLAGR